MLLQKRKRLRFPATPKDRLRLGIWLICFLLCAGMSLFVLRGDALFYSEYAQTEVLPQDFTVYEIAPEGSAVQEFTAQGRSSGFCWEIFLNILRSEESQGELSIRITDLSTGETVTEISGSHSQIPGCPDLEASLQEAYRLLSMNPSDRPAWSEINRELTEHTTFSAPEEFRLHSGRKYALEIVNHSQTHSLYLLGNDAVFSGKLLVNGERQQGFLNLCFMRRAAYTPSKLVWVMLAVTNLTVLGGLWLVLFTDVKEHMLYLVLAAGFGLVALFDLTPLYGFDMTFQFDSTYIASNRLMGLEGRQNGQSLKNPEESVAYYYRRACDDYSQYQFYYHDEVYANYADLKAALADPFAPEEDRELILVESDRGYVNESPYLFLPQAIGFTIARLLGLGLYPMLQLARVCMYAVFVAVMFFAIRAVPFGKRIFLIWALVPTVLVQTLSLSYDAMIISMSYFVIAKVLQLAYAERKPRLLDWLLLLGVSALLLPCKWIYAPVSCSFLLVVYRQYLLPAGNRWKSTALKAGGILLVLTAAFVIMKWPMFVSIYRSVFVNQNTSLYETEAYSIAGMLADPVWTIFVFLNTIRDQLGYYLVNAVQLFEIQLGSSDGITLIVFALLLLESCCVTKERMPMRTGERVFLQLVTLGVFLLVMLASFRWTPTSSNVVEGLQGRYLTPVLPMLFLSWHNNRLVRIEGNADLLVKAGCCIFPAISLMNMYLWTVSR